MPESKPRVIDPSEIFRSPNYANLVEVDTIVALPKGG